MQENKKEEFEFKQALAFLKKNWRILLFVGILLFAFFLRIYHVDYPVVGYHNWKEVHYLTESRNFARDGFFAHGFFVPAVDYPGIYEDPSGKHPDTFPVISIIVGSLFSIFGISLTLARLVGIAFSLGTIVMMFLFAKRLFKNELVAWVAAFFTAMLPLFIFFSHNVQLMNPGVFFMVTSLYFFVRWVKDDKPKLLYLSALFVSLATLTKYGFAIVVVPMLFMVPKQRYKNIKKYTKQLLYSALILSPVVLWILYVEGIIASSAGTGTAIQQSFFRPELVFSSDWIDIMKSFVKDNYTSLGFILATFGSLFVVFLGKNTLATRFLKGSVVGIILFCFIMAFKMQGHSYHQFPIAPLIIMLMAYGVLVISIYLSQFLAKGKRAKLLRLIFVLFFIFLLYNPSMEAKDRQFDTQFPGLDVAGEYIKEHSQEDEWIVHSGHQDYGVLWHADRKGTDGGIPTLEDLKYAEDNLNAKWVFLYQWGLSSLQKEDISDYLSQNYRPVQVAAQGESLIYILLNRGGSFDPNGLNNLIEGKEVKSKTYEFSGGVMGIQYIDIE